MKFFPMSWRVPLAVGCLLAAPAFSDDDTLQEIVVTASLRGVRAAELPLSVTVLD